MSKTIYDRVLHVRRYFCLYERGSPTPKGSSDTRHDHLIFSTTIYYPIQPSNTFQNHTFYNCQYSLQPSDTLCNYPIHSATTKVRPSNTFHRRLIPSPTIQYSLQYRLQPNTCATYKPLRLPRILCDCPTTTHCARPLQYGI